MKKRKEKRNLGILTDLCEIKKEKGWIHAIGATSFILFLVTVVLPVSVVAHLIRGDLF